MGYVLLQPKKLAPRIDKLRVLDHQESWKWAVQQAPKGQPVALDFEYRGDWSDDPSVSYPVGVALSDTRGSCYIPFVTSDGQHDRPKFLAFLALLKDEQTPLLAHNVYADAGWAVREGFELNWHACTYATAKLLATEGWKGQRWGLKGLQTELLGWEETNESELHSWLVMHSCTKAKSKVAKPGKYLAGDGAWYSPDKSAMWQAPVGILGHYSALDADACWQLWTHVLSPVLTDWSHFLGVRQYWADYPSYIRLLIGQRLRGIQLNLGALHAYTVQLEERIAVATAALLADGSVRGAAIAWCQARAAESLSEEPPRHTAAELGAYAKRQAAYQARLSRWTAECAKAEARAAVGGGADGPTGRRAAARTVRPDPPRGLELGPKLSGRWKQWEAKKARLAEAVEKLEAFNLDSPAQLGWLLYEALRLPVQYSHKTGKPSTDKAALKALGPLGRQLLARTKLVKLLQFCKQMQTLQRDGILRPGFRTPGTLTGRLGGSKPNIQQMPKDPEFLRVFAARPGYTLVACDVSSLENRVLAELSKDPSLMQLYGPSARVGNDSYLFNGSNMPIIGPVIRAAGYDPDNWTPESIAAAKKACPKERAIAKQITLAANYGAGPRRIHESVVSEGGTATLEQVQTMHAGFWTLYAGIKEYEAWLRWCWNRNEGWVLNGIGRPIGVDESKSKDLVNRVCQSTGHDCFIRLLLITDRLLKEAGLDAHPWIGDLHDACYYEVRDSDVAAALDILETKAYSVLNAELQGQVPLSGEAHTGAHWGELI